MNRFLKVFLIIAIVVIALNYQWINKGREKTSLPEYAKRTSIIEAAYSYTLENPELLDYIPCYCNCHRSGHQNVKDCFIKEFKEALYKIKPSGKFYLKRKIDAIIAQK